MGFFWGGRGWNITLIKPAALCSSPIAAATPPPIPKFRQFSQMFPNLRPALFSLPAQAAGEGVDRGAPAGNMPPLLRPRGNADLCRQPGGKVQLEQEGVWNGAEQLLLGLLLHPSVRWLRQRQVRNRRATVDAASRYASVRDPCTRRVGGEKVLLLAATAWGSLTAFTPILAHICSQPIFSMTLSRFLMGLLQGETFFFFSHDEVGGTFRK